MQQQAQQLEGNYEDNYKPDHVTVEIKNTEVQDLEALQPARKVRTRSRSQSFSDNDIVTEAARLRSASFSQPKDKDETTTISSGTKSGESVALVDEEEDKKVDITEHTMTFEQLESKFGTSTSKGLTSAKVAEIKERDGPNSLTPPKETPEWLKFMGHMFGGFANLLWAGSILCFIVYGIDASLDNLYLGIVLAVVVIITGVFGYYQDAKSAAVMDSFKNLTPTVCSVIRDGKPPSELNAVELVVGDLVICEGGNKLPADVRMITTSGLKVDNSSLTGEPDPLNRGVKMTDPSPWETKNLAFFGTSAVEGQATALVIRTGDRTVLGQIATATTGEKKPETLMTKEIRYFVKIITTIAVIIGVSFFIAALVIGYHWLRAAVIMIGIIVANVPEGLLVTLTISLSLTAQKMFTKKVEVKNVETIETLGSVTLIASDKTGTLTQNRMTATHCVYNGKVRAADTSLDEGAFEAENPEFKALQRCATLCNFTFFTTENNEVLKREYKGNASEAALIKFCEPLRSIDSYRAANTKLASVPFNSTNKWMLTVHEQELGANDTRYLICMKGAPEKIIAMCATMMVDGEEVEATDERKAAMEATNISLGEKGERVLAFAQMLLPLDTYPPGFEFNVDDRNFPMPELGELPQVLDGLVFIGLISLMDPPREAVPDAVKACHRAGIKVVMVTGDHPVTAKAIASRIGIITLDTKEDIIKAGGQVQGTTDPSVDAIVVPGPLLNTYTEADWEYTLSRKEIVFARTLPEQKQMIVKKMQEMDHVVAVTGDGVNDSPALKTAQVGIAMGSGNEVAQDAADMILRDDNFASIVAGIEEGRLIFDNLKKSIAYTLSSNIPEITPFLAMVAFGIPIPLETVMILCIDLGTDMIPAISLAYEKSESDIMKRKPRDAKRDKLVTNQLIGFAYGQIGMIQAICGFVCYFWVFSDYGFTAGSLMGAGPEWTNKDAIVAGVPFEFEYNGEQLDRSLVLGRAQTCFLVSIVMVQWADVVICKTRINSLFTQGMRNTVMMVGIIEETLLALALVYVPFLQLPFKTRDLTFYHWLYPLPFTVFIVVYDEVRKWWMRKYRNGCLYKYTYY